jgi:hypothetical protein
MHEGNGWDALIQAYERKKLLDAKPMDQMVAEIHQMLTFLLEKMGGGIPYQTLMERYQQETNERQNRAQTVRTRPQETS